MPRGQLGTIFRPYRSTNLHRDAWSGPKPTLGGPNTIGIRRSSARNRHTIPIWVRPPLVLAHLDRGYRTNAYRFHIMQVLHRSTDMS